MVLQDTTDHQLEQSILKPIRCRQPEWYKSLTDLSLLKRVTSIINKHVSLTAPETEVGGSLQVQGQPDLYSQFYTGQGFKAKTSPQNKQSVSVELSFFLRLAPSEWDFLRLR